MVFNINAERIFDSIDNSRSGNGDVNGDCGGDIWTLIFPITAEYNHRDKDSILEGSHRKVVLFANRKRGLSPIKSLSI